MTADRSIDFGKTASDYGAYRAGFPEALYDRLAKFGIGKTGQRLLDLGTGLDPSDALLSEARRLDSEAGVVSDYVTARAEHTGLPDHAFDVVAAGQCWHWFDRAAAAAEVRRLLAPGGALVIAHFDWIPLPGNLTEATERLIEAHNPDWTMGGGAGLPREWLADVAMAGFRRIETFSFDEHTPYSHQAWRGRIRASAGVGASLSPDAVERFDDALAELLAERFPEDPLAVLHRCFALICRAP
ncbi:MAG: methyltransferase domain-containing protein [Proteobacteria bacterium]|nr:methyltransferase domain-containing protein [Pseudomonadota bacterium]